MRGAARRMLGVLATGSLARTSPSRVATRAQCDDFPTSSPMAISGLLGGSMVVSSNRRADWRPFLRRAHYLAVAPAPGSFLSVVRSGERLRWQRPPALFGAGADGHPEAPDWRPLGACPYRRQCAECSPPKFIGGLLWNAMGVDAPLGERAISLQLEWPPFALCGRVCAENASIFGAGS